MLHVWLILQIDEISKEWLEAGELQRVVLVIMSKATSEVLERWNFNIETDAEVVEKGYVNFYANFIIHFVFQ